MYSSIHDFLCVWVKSYKHTNNMLASLTLAWGNNLSFLLNGEPAALIYYWWVFFHAGLSVISVPPVGTSSSASFITPDTADVSSFQNCTLGTDGLRVHLWLYLKVWTAQSGLTRVWTSHICLPELLDTRPAGVSIDVRIWASIDERAWRLGCASAVVELVCGYVEHRWYITANFLF